MANVLRWTDGQLYEVPDDKVGEALSNDGFTVPTEEEHRRYMAGKQTDIAQTEGLARGLTLGASDYLFNAINQGDAVKYRKEENPISAIGGEAVGSMFGLGKLGMAGKGVKAAIGTGMVQGGLSGLTQVLSENALYDSEITAEKLLASTGKGALVGGALGGAIGTVAKAGEKIAQTTLGQKLSGAMKSVASKMWAKELKPAGELANESNWQDLVDYGAKKGIFTNGTTPEAGLRAAQEEMAKELPKIAPFLEKMEARSPLLNDVTDVAKKIKEAIGNRQDDAALLIRKQADDLVSRAKEYARASDVYGDAYWAAQNKASGFSAQKVTPKPDAPVAGGGGGTANMRAPKSVDSAAAKTQDLESATAKTLDGPEPLKLTPEMEAAPRDVAKTGEIPGQAGAPVSMPPKPPPPPSWADVWGMKESLLSQADESSKAAGKALDDLFDEMAGKNFLNAPGFLREAQLNYQKAAKLAELFEKRLGQPTVGLWDGVLEEGAKYGLAGMAGAGPIGGIKAGAFGAGRKAFENLLERTSMQRAGALLSLGESDAASKLAKAFGEHIATKSAALGRFGPMLEAAAARSPQDLLETHMQLANSDAGEEYMAAVGLKHEGPDEARAGEQRLAVLQAIQAQAAVVDSAIDESLGAFLSGKGKLVPSKPVNYEKKLAEVQALLRDPESAFAEMPGMAVGAAPGTVTQAQARQMQIAQYLHDRAPKSPYEGLPDALKRPWKPSTAEVRTWGQVVEAAENPLAVVERLQYGTVTKAQVETLQTLYPRIYAELQEKLTEKLYTAKAPLRPYQKAQVELILGSDRFGLTKQQRLAIQDVHATLGRKEGVQPPQGAGPDGRQQVNVEANLETQAQKLQGR